MSVRTAIVKLAATAAGGALLGGGAVHVAESPKTTNPQYVKHAKVSPVAKRAAPHRAHRVIPQRQVKRIRRVITRTTTCEPAPQMAMAAIPMLPPLPPQTGGGGGGPVVIGGGWGG